MRWSAYCGQNHQRRQDAPDARKRVGGTRKLRQLGRDFGSCCTDRTMGDALHTLTWSSMTVFTVTSSLPGQPSGSFLISLTTSHTCLTSGSTLAATFFEGPSADAGYSFCRMFLLLCMSCFGLTGA